MLTAGSGCNSISGHDVDGRPSSGNAWSCGASIPEMFKVYSFIGATAGSYAGWALGSTVGVMTAFMVGMVGTGVGIYVGRRVARHYGG